MTAETGVTVSSIYFLTHFQQASTATIVTATIFSVEQRDFPTHLFCESLIPRLTKNEYNLLAGCNRIMEQSNLTISIIEKRLFYLNSGSLLLNNLSTLVHHSAHLWNNALDIFCFCLPKIDALPSETFLSHLSPSDNPDFDHSSGGGGGCA